jgi:hypothetical protein
MFVPKPVKGATSKARARLRNLGNLKDEAFQMQRAIADRKTNLSTYVRELRAQIQPKAEWMARHNWSMPGISDAAFRERDRVAGEISELEDEIAGVESDISKLDQEQAMATQITPGFSDPFDRLMLELGTNANMIGAA